MTSQIHIAAQYLAAAQISFLDKKDDDSHTNLGFDTQKGYLQTWVLNDDGCTIVLDYKKFALYWLNNNNARLSISLDGKTHREVVEWMQKVAEGMGISKKFTYDLHYDLPYEVTDSYRFSITAADTAILDALVHYRTLANEVLAAVIDQTSLTSTIRIWPHHFDTGAFSYTAEKPELSIGLGLAIPDSISDTYYFYISAYKGHDNVATDGFAPLPFGTWKNDGFTGAILPITDVTKAEGIAFFKAAIAAYLTE